MSDQPISTKTTESKVGYKRPPAKSQFRKGQSGNPRGRRKGQRNLATVLREVLSQTVKVKRAGKTERMSKGEALIQMLLSKAHSGDARAIEAVLVLTEKIARIDTPEPKLAGPGNYHFMLVPGMAASAEEWQRELNMRHELAEIREMVAAAAAAGKFLTAGQRAGLRKAVDVARAAGTTLTASQLATVREWLGPARAALIGVSSGSSGVGSSMFGSLTSPSPWRYLAQAVPPLIVRDFCERSLAPSRYQSGLFLLQWF
jgi:hypothetical protein